MNGLVAIWRHVRRGLIALGMLLGTINTAIILTILYLGFVPWVRLGYWISRKDVLGRRLHQTKSSTWVPLEGSARAPTAEDLEHLF